MQLFVLRHAPAEDPAEGQPDAWRALTPDGAKKLRRCVRGLRKSGARFDRVLTSPFTRATATAAALAPLADGEPVITELLTRAPCADLLALFAGADSVAVVGHAPWLHELIGWLAFGDTRAGAAIVLKKPGLAILSGDPVPGGMQLHALLAPKQLRALG